MEQLSNLYYFYTIILKHMSLSMQQKDLPDTQLRKKKQVANQNTHTLNCYVQKIPIKYICTDAYIHLETKSTEYSLKEHKPNW